MIFIFVGGTILFAIAMYVGLLYSNVPQDQGDVKSESLF